MERNISDLTVENTANYSSGLEIEVGKQLELRKDPVFVDPSTMVSDADDLSLKGILQGLADLGYLDERDSEFASLKNEDPLLIEAVEAWRLDTLKLGAQITFEPEKNKPAFRPITVSDLVDPLVVLTIQTGFDGQLRFSEFPKVGDVSLAARILQFRLMSFNRFDEKVGTAFSKKSLLAFKRLKEHFAESNTISDLNLFNRMGNGSKLSSAFCQNYRSRIFAVQWEASGGTREAEKFYLRQKNVSPLRRRKFKIRKSRMVLSHKSKEKKNEGLPALLDSDINSLGLELLQLRLWQHGFYKGALDADWKEQSRKALEDFRATFTGEFNLKPEEVSVNVKGGVLINLAFVLEELLQIADSTASQISKKHIDQITDELLPDPIKEKETEVEWNKLEVKANELKDDEVNALKPQPVDSFRGSESRKTQRRRRVNFSFFGVKAAITGWVRRTINKVKTWIKKTAQQIKDAIMAGLTSIGAFFRHVRDRVRRVVRVAKAAVKRFYYWVSGSPFGTGNPKSNQFVATRWSFDFDTMIVASAGCSIDLINNHSNRIRFMNASFSFMVRLAFRVLEILIKIGLGNWLRAAWAIYKGIRDWKNWTVNNPFLDYAEGTYIT